MRFTVPQLHELARKGEKLVMLTCYDSSFAKVSDEAGVEILLIGDSLGMVIQGHDSTLPVTLNEMEYHVRLVARGSSRAMVVADMPFGSYQVGTEDAVRSAIRLVKDGGAQAVKLEGGVDVADSIRRIVAAQVPVMGHVGLTPQSVQPRRLQGAGQDG
jgi:3-methyl-2-oxobutanoate hydroxymethyltransferase